MAGSCVLLQNVGVRGITSSVAVDNAFLRTRNVTESMNAETEVTNHGVTAVWLTL